MLLDDHQRVDHDDGQNVAPRDDDQSDVSSDECMDDDHYSTVLPDRKIAVSPEE